MFDIEKHKTKTDCSYGWWYWWITSRSNPWCRYERSTMTFVISEWSAKKQTGARRCRTVLSDTPHNKFYAIHSVDSGASKIQKDLDLLLRSVQFGPNLHSPQPSTSKPLKFAVHLRLLDIALSFILHVWKHPYPAAIVAWRQCHCSALLPATTA